MARIFITGSTQGLGLMTGRLLLEQGHEVVLHARNERRARDLIHDLPSAGKVLVGDVTTLAGMRDLARQANEIGRFDAVIHNVGLGFGEQRTETGDGVTQLWAVNVLAPYVLTALMHRPERLIYLGSGMHTMAEGALDDVQWTRRAWSSSHAYAETKLHDLLIAFGIARRWRDVLSNAASPGWVATRMGGPGARDDINQGHLTQAWLATSNDTGVRVTGRYFHHLAEIDPSPPARDETLQDRLLDYCREVSGLSI
jgi:NAD(P)-dependent dehydrogenase (short-subunit alcohol dehydrogenase family)